MNKNAILIELSAGERTDFGRVDFARQSPEQQVFSAIWTLESEVNNGGFEQYFLNDRGATFSLAPTALRRIGANQCAGVVERAIRAAFGSHMPATPDEVEARAAELNEETQDALGRLDAAFYAYPDNLTELLFEFVLQHPGIFGSVEAR